MPNCLEKKKKMYKMTLFRIVLAAITHIKMLLKNA